MEVLDLRLKMMIQWVINKKQAIYNLVLSKLPIFRAIKQFIQAYTRQIDDFIGIVQKTIKDINKNNGNRHTQTLIQLFYLIRQKQLVNMEEWKDKLWLLQDKYAIGTSADTRKIPDIFKDIDANIEYYSQLRTKLQLAKKKIEQDNKTRPTNNLRNKNSQKQKQYVRGWETERVRQPSSNNSKQKKVQKQALKQLEIQKNDNLFRKYADYGDRQAAYHNNAKKPDIYAGIYDLQYSSGKPKAIRKNISNHVPPKQSNNVKQRTNTTFNQYSSSNNKPLSPYKLVNPKYNNHKQQPTQLQQKIQPFTNYRLHTQPQKYTTMPLTIPQIRNENYKKFKQELYQQMERQVKNEERPKYSVYKYLNQQQNHKDKDSPIKKFKDDFSYEKPKQYSTANTQRYAYLNTKGKYATDRQKDNILTGRKIEPYQVREFSNQQEQLIPIDKKPKKYQYLFNDDRDYYHLKQFQRNYDKPIKQKQQPVHNYASQNYKQARTNYPSVQQTKPKTTLPQKSYKYHYEKYLQDHMNQNKYYSHKNEDSLQLEDRLGSQLQVDLPTILRNQPLPKQNNNLQHLLADSLLSSKKWDDSEIDVLNQQVYSEDSLEEDQGKAIRQTGKFNEFRYTDEDQYVQNQYDSENRYKNKPTFDFELHRPLSIQKIRSSQSKDLNVSFGKN